MNTADVRRQMVQQQIRTWDVFDPAVLGVAGDIERERFVPDVYAHLAYAETEIPLGHGQKMMTPLLEGRLLQALELASDDNVLEIGTGSGYLTACIARLAGTVTSIDLYPDFIETASSRLEELGIDNATLHCMDAMSALPDGEFDAIAVTGSVPQPSESFLNVLRPGGQMFIVVGEAPVMRAQLVTHGDGGEWQAETLFETALQPLVNAPSLPPFAF